jgi:hypothetical protein
MQGVRDAFKHWWLVLRCSWIGAGLGAVPGIGASIIDWVAYGHAARSEKGAKDTFAKGDVRGVIASESSNNAKEGGALVPTIAFGVPGSASMALILGAFLIHGLVPGPDMVTKRLDVTYLLVWSVAVANIFAAGICFSFANQLSKIALIRVTILAPTVLAVVYVGAFQGSRQWGDIWALLIFGVLGFIMKRLRWPRPPLVLGFVLGALVERYMFISVERYGAEWIWSRPIVVVVFLITIWGVTNPLIRQWRERRKNEREGRGLEKRVIAFQRRNVNLDLLFTLVLTGLFIASLVISGGWEFGARLVPQVVGWTAVIILSILTLVKLFYERPLKKGTHGPEGEKTIVQGTEQSEVHFDIVVDFGDIPIREMWRRALWYFFWCFFFFGAAAVVGLLPAMFLFMVGYMRHGKESWKTVLSIAVPLWIFCYVLFHHVLVIPWPQTIVGDMFPVLRTINDLNLF